MNECNVMTESEALRMGRSRTEGGVGGTVPAPPPNNVMYLPRPVSFRSASVERNAPCNAQGGPCEALSIGKFQGFLILLFLSNRVRSAPVERNAFCSSACLARFGAVTSDLPTCSDVAMCVFKCTCPVASKVPFHVET